MKGHQRTVCSYRQALGTVLWICLLPTSLAAETVRAELGRETAWVGQAVPLVITLYAPGPFDGTASFELPELARTVILKVGNPVVGSESVDGETWLTQRHEFKLFTQLTGTLEVPPMTVHFEAKPDFTGPAEPRRGRTPALSWKSRPLPESADSGTPTVTADSLKVTQNWLPAGKTLRVGELAQRTITQQAEGTTAMLLRPADMEAPEGVRLYADAPRVEDQVERGQAKATRIDTLRYAFERSGSVALPELTYLWWDPQRESFQRITLPGRTWQISAAKPAAEASPPPDRRWIAGGVVAILLLLSWGGWRAVRCVVFRPAAQEWYAASQVRRAARSDRAEATYQAILAWQHCLDAMGGEVDWELVMAEPAWGGWRKQWTALSAKLFSDSGMDWSGRLLAAEFPRLRTRLLQPNLQASQPALLSPLNPVTGSASGLFSTHE